VPSRYLVKHQQALWGPPLSKTLQLPRRPPASQNGKNDHIERCRLVDPRAQKRAAEGSKPREKIMQPRLNPSEASPSSYKAISALEMHVQNSGLEKRLIHLIKLRASIINGCAFCVDMHVKEARHDGLGEQWINMISVWHESPVYDARERALLGWTDAVTNIAQTGIPDAAFECLRQNFSDEEMVKITVAIGTINVWNRVAVGFRAQHPVDKG
jgi:AhpD family alkylhydroperoxidase